MLMARRQIHPGVLHVRLGVLLVVLAGVAGLASPIAGATADALLVVAFGILGRRSAAAAGLLLVPMLRLLWLAMPVKGLAELHWLPLIAIPYLVVTLLVVRSERLGLADVGVQPGGTPLTAVLVVVGWAAAGIGLAAVAGDAVAWGSTGGSPAWLFVALYAPLVAVTEELALRGVLPRMLEEAAPTDAMPLAVVAAASLALGAGSPWWIAIALVTPIVNGFIVARTGSLLAVMAGHTVFLVLLNL
jgi:hypothetical protein